MHFTRGKSNYQLYPATNLVGYTKDYPRTICHCCNSGTNIMEETNHFLIGLKSNSTE